MKKLVSALSVACLLFLAAQTAHKRQGRPDGSVLSVAERQTLRDAPKDNGLSSAYDQANQAVRDFRKEISAEREAPTVQIVIYHTTDIHGYADFSKGDAAKRSPDSGGAASLQTFLKSEKRPYLWFDSGDWFQGPPESNFSRGDEVIDVFNALHLTAAGIGNHDFDYGTANLKRLVAQAHFSVLGSNVGGVPGIRPYVLETVKGIKIGVFSLLTATMSRGLASDADIQGASFGDEEAAAAAAVRQLKAQGAQIIIALTHLGIEEYGDFKAGAIKAGDIYIAKHVPGINLILGGHTHVLIDPPMAVGTTLVTQPSCRLAGVERIVLDVDAKTGAIRKEEAHFIKLDPSRYPPDDSNESVQKIVEAYKDKVNKIMDAPLGSSAVDMTKNQNAEDLISNWVTDTFRDYGDGHGHPTDIALINTGAIRDGLPRSDSLTYRDVYKVQPFDGDSVATFELSGADLRKTVEKSAPQGFGERISIRFSGNVRIVYDPQAPAGQKVKSVKVNGADLDDGKIYTVMSTCYAANSMLKKAFGLDVRNIVVNPVLPRDILAQAVRAHSPVTVRIDGRAIVLSGTAGPDKS